MSRTTRKGSHVSGEPCCARKSVDYRLLAIVGQGFEDLELAVYTDLAGWTRLLDEMPGVEVSIAGFHKIIRSQHGLRLLRDVSLHDAAAREWDGLIIPGGYPNSGYDEIFREPVPSLIRHTHERGGIIATSCTGIFAVGQAGLLKGRRATTYVSPGGCALCTENHKRLASYGALVCDETVVADDRILSDAGPVVGMKGALELFKHLIGEEAVSRIQVELAGAHREAHPTCCS